MATGTSYKSQHAFILIKAAIDSGSIKLRGSATSGSAEDAANDAAIDASYLVTLLNELQKDQQG